MPRAARLVIPGTPHHITHRGQNQQPVFLDDTDRRNYLNLLRECSHINSLKIHGYCLMPNHIHLIATPETETGLTKVIGFSHNAYARKFNRRHDRSGKLWQKRFRSCPLDDNHFLQALIYVDRNPVRAKMVELPWQYQWSSARAHIGQEDPAGLISPVSWKEIANLYGWEEVLRQKMNNAVLLELRKHTQSGQPLGNF